MGLTTQIPMQYEIVSNKATNEYRETSLAKSRIIIRKPKVPVTEKNYMALQFLDMLKNLDNRFFIDCPTERITLIHIILYLSDNWETEYNLSKKIYCFNNNCLPTYYDPISQFNDILQDNFLDSYSLRSYHYNAVSELIWDHCALHLGYQI